MLPLHRTVRFASGALVAVATGFLTPRAHACGGCFGPPAGASSVVTSHRMVFAVSDTRTVLWDQFAYSGSPADFSWVLPVRRDAYIETADVAFFEALEAVTAVRVIPPTLDCFGSFGNDGCGCANSSSEKITPLGGGDGRGGVVVLHEGTVGPYETVTVSSANPGALREWLASHGYGVPADIEPVIDAYVEEGMDFIALRLSPDRGVQEMTPVRVVTPGGPPTLPLRMVAAGIDTSVAITLYVISEGRSEMPDLATVSVKTKDISYDFLTNTSNYDALRREALARNGGHSYLPAFALPQAFTATITPPTGFGPTSYSVSNGSAFVSTLGELYFAQAIANAGSFETCVGPFSALASTQLFVENCKPSDPLCTDLGPGESSSRTLECGAFTDVAAAHIGMHPDRVWVTRFELDLPRSALAMDCVVAPAVDPKPVENWLVADDLENAPCEPSIFTSSLDARTRRELPSMFAYASAALALLLRRIPRRGRRSRAASVLT